MPTPEQSQAALRLVTAAAATDAAQLLGLLSGTAEERRSGLLEAVPSIIGYYSDGSSALAADFYDEQREQASARGRFTAEPVVLDRGEKIGRAVAWASAPLFDDAADLTATRLTLVVQAETARPYRDTITTNMQRDAQAEGWRRVTAAGACKFCRMLADRGAVYREGTARFAAHGPGPHGGGPCHCTAQPVFNGQGGEEASAMQYIASKRYRTQEERDKNNAKVRAYLNEHFADVPG